MQVKEDAEKCKYMQLFATEYQTQELKSMNLK